MVKVYGFSDDLVEIEGSSYSKTEIDCWSRGVRFKFTDGTVITIRFENFLNKENSPSVWKITVKTVGSAHMSLFKCNPINNSKLYSDVFEIDAEIVSCRKF